MSDWIHKVLEMGSLFAIVVLVFYGSWRIASWVGNHLVIPSRDRMFSHLDVIDDNVKKQTLMLGEATHAIQQQAYATENVSVMLNKLQQEGCGKMMP